MGAEAFTRDEDLGHLTMFNGANEGGALGGLHREMKHGVAECGIGGMTVGFPVAGAGVEFDGAIV